MHSLTHSNVASNICTRPLTTLWASARWYSLIYEWMQICHALSHIVYATHIQGPSTHSCSACVMICTHIWVNAHHAFSQILYTTYVQGPSIRSIKVSLGISRTNADCQWNPVYNTFHRFLIAETKRFVGSSVNVILTRQTCGQRSSRAAESKHRALENHFTEWICYMFLMSKCRGD